MPVLRFIGTTHSQPVRPTGFGFALLWAHCVYSRCNALRSVNHSIGEYVRGDVHTNTVEDYFSIFKRGIYGTFHHISQQHLKRYLAEFDFRYKERSALGVNDKTRAIKAVKGVVGKRLTYHQPDKAAHT